MRRRDLIATAGAAIAAWPFSALAQQKFKIGVLVLGAVEPFWSLFQEGLRDLGYHTGRNLELHLRTAGRLEPLADLAAELVRLKVDVIVTYQTPSAVAAKAATREVPIVMAGAGDPVGTGLVASLARPGGNITGISGTTAELGTKTLELLRDIKPSIQRVAVLANAPDPFTRSFLRLLQPAAALLKIELQTLMLRTPDELDAAFDSMQNHAADAVIVQPSLPRARAAALALKYRLPAASPLRAFASEGGLAGYSANSREIFLNAAAFVDKILKGARPADLPVEQPTKFDMVINLRTATALGLEVPPTLLLRADEVIE